MGIVYDTISFITSLLTAAVSLAYLWVVCIWLPKKCFRIAKKIWDI